MTTSAERCALARSRARALVLLLLLAAPQAWPCVDCEQDLDAAPAKPAPPLVSLSITREGFLPAKLQVKAGAMVRLRVTRQAESQCAHGFSVQHHTETLSLPVGQAIEVDLMLKPGEKALASCARSKTTALLIAE